jgi:aryl-alcohol dehydrogenase-like predicted oxidoreductase
MRYRLLGKSGLRVSEVALGTMTFGEDWGWGASREASRRVFEAFAGAGGTFIDTACNYTNGTSERFVGEFVKADRDQFVVATKYTLSTRLDDPNGGGNGRKTLMRSVEESLRRLDLDHVDLLWLHCWDGTTRLDEILRGLDDLVRQGKVHHIGFSDTPAWVVSRADLLADLRGWAPLVALQLPYALVRREVERELLPMAKALDLAVTPWGILAGGVLSGTYTRGSSEPTRMKPEDIPPKRLEVARLVDAIADELGWSSAQVATRWVLEQQHRAQIIPILGARTEKQLESALSCLDLELPGEARARLDEATIVELGFPHDFLASENVRSLIHGSMRERLELRA